MCLMYSLTSNMSFDYESLGHNIQNFFSSVQFSSVQFSHSVVSDATPWIAARRASLSITYSRSSLRLTSSESVMPSRHLILCRPLLLLPPVPPSIRVFSNESTLRMRWPKYWSFSFSISPSNEYAILQFHSWNCIYLEKNMVQKDTCTAVCIATLFTIAKTWKQHKCPPQKNG